MELDDLRTFVSLAATRSFSQTARELYLTQPGVTRRLQRLEEHLGAPLVDRRRRPLALTPAGTRALDKCHLVLNAVGELRAASGGQGLPLGELRVGVAHALTEVTLAAPLARVRRECDRVSVLLTTGWSRDLVTKVQTGALDAALLLLPRSEGLPTGVAGECLGSERLIAIARKERGARRLRSFADLDGQSWILNPEGCAARAALRRALREAGITMRVGVETYTYELQLALVAEGRGYGLVPARLLARSAHRSRLHPLPIRSPGFELQIWSIHRALPAALAGALEVLSGGLKDEL